MAKKIAICHGAPDATVGPHELADDLERLIAEHEPGSPEALRAGLACVAAALHANGFAAAVDALARLINPPPAKSDAGQAALAVEEAGGASRAERQI